AAADINSQSPEGCLEGTRVELLNDLRAWSCDPNSPQIFWLDGMAGTGKSAIARSFCHILDKNQQLGGSFFCLRGDANRGDPKRILPTLAMHLAHQDATYKSALLAALDKGISWNANLQIQVENLLEQPLRSAHGSGQSALVLVIDALDELDDEDATKDLLRRLVAAVPQLPIKVFVTSRPERHIRPHFRTPADFRRVLRLHDIENNIVKADISLYLTNRLAAIRAESSPMVPPDWASHADIEALTHRAGKLFIYAFTAAKYIGENPSDRLRTLIGIKVDAKGPLTKPLDNVYRHILSDAMGPDRRERGEIVLTKQILAAVLTVSQPLSVASLGGLLEVSAQRVRAMLDQLHAVIHVPPDDDEGVLSTFHASFGDFLTTTGRAPDEILINRSAAHVALFSNCIRVMDSELCFNVSKCPTSYLPNTAHKLTIPALLQYACLSWPYHIAAASAAEASDVDVFVTLSHLKSLQDVFLPKFLFWVEVLSAMNKASVASSLIMTVLTAKCFARAPEPMTEFLGDANEFVVSSLEAIETSVAHIYLSALPCLRPTSKVAKAFWPKFIRSDDKTICVWDARTGKPVMGPIQAHTESVLSVVFSPDGARIVSGSVDYTIRVWDARTGEAIMEPIQGHTGWVLSVGLSPDGARIASGSDDKTIRVWDARTGKAVMKPIWGHTGSVNSVAFSPDGACIVSGSDDKTIRVWDARKGKAVMWPIQGHTESVLSVAFSPDGTRIVSGSDDKTIRVWIVRMAKTIRPIQGHTGVVWSVVFSPDGVRIASSSDDHTIRVWDARTGDPVIKHIPGSQSVRSVAFSPDSKHIASGSDGGKICMWDARTGKLVMKPIRAHMGSVLSVVFSPDGARIVSGSSVGTIRVWDAKTGKAITRPIQRHTDWVRSVAFSPDGARTVSGSRDKTICMWDTRKGKAVMWPIQGHTELVRSVAFSPDGTCIVSGSDDQTIRVWDAKTGEAVMAPIRGHTDSVQSVVFSPDGAHIASGSSDETICIWDARTGE
ncbi:WD40-repeat-containing domain protein, partial [Mycena leptocephala]